MQSRIALIGAGRWGKNILRVLASQPEAEMAMVVYSGSSETAKFLAEEYPQVPTSTDINDILSEPTISHVCIATPIETHYTLTKLCLEAGKHVFVEKPLASTSDEVSELHELAAAKDLQLATGYVFLFDQALQQLAKITRETADIQLKLNWQKWGTFDSPITTNLFVHELAIAHALLGQFKTISSSKLSENQVELTAVYENGTAEISIDREKETKRKLIEASVNGATFLVEGGKLFETTDGGHKLILENDSSVLLEIELTSFLENKKTFSWNEIDLEVAAILEKLEV